DKILADWNGLMIAALANAGLVLDERGWIAMAARAFMCVAAHMSRGERLGHSWRDQRLLFPGLASDHAAMIRAALALHEATGEVEYFDRALGWQATLDRHYANAETAGYYLTADDAEGLVVRPSATTDVASPNANAVAAQNLVRLSVLSGQLAWREQADQLFEGILSRAGDNLFGHLALLNALDLRLRGAEIVVTGEDARARALLAAARKLPFLDRVVVHAPATLRATRAGQEKIAASTECAAFICLRETCAPRVREPEAVADAVAAMRSTREAGARG